MSFFSSSTACAPSSSPTTSGKSLVIGSVQILFNGRYDICGTVLLGMGHTSGARAGQNFRGIVGFRTVGSKGSNPTVHAEFPLRWWSCSVGLYLVLRDRAVWGASNMIVHVFFCWGSSSNSELYVKYCNKNVCAMYLQCCIYIYICRKKRDCFFTSPQNSFCCPLSWLSLTPPPPPLSPLPPAWAQPLLWSL